MLRNPIDYGDFVWEGTPYRGSDEQLISKKLFDAVQAVFDRANRPRYGKHQQAFVGLLTCGRCGCAITGEVQIPAESWETGCQGRNSQLPDHGGLKIPPRNPFTISRVRARRATLRQRLSEICIHISDGQNVVTAVGVQAWPSGTPRIREPLFPQQCFVGQRPQEGHEIVALLGGQGETNERPAPGWGCHGPRRGTGRRRACDRQPHSAQRPRRSSPRCRRACRAP